MHTEKLPPAVQAVADSVEQFTGKNWQDLCSPYRGQRLSLVRKMAAAVLREISPDMSLREIGQFFGGRDHSTVVYWMSSIEKILEDDRMYRGIMQNIYQEAVSRRDAEHPAAVS
tara:strand:- start:1669 stop:2010 length:342 start_codon:yes stop_codon:yes gene_type:complete